MLQPIVVVGPLLTQALSSAQSLFGDLHEPRATGWHGLIVEVEFGMMQGRTGAIAQQYVRAGPFF